MANGKLFIYGGDGHGKSPAALGRAVGRACRGESVVIIQFLKEKCLEETEFMRRLEPEIKMFKFEKAHDNFDNLTPEEKEEETRNILNGINFARKVISTGECDLLILDEVLGIVDNGIITAEELKALVDARPEHMDIILTGISEHKEIYAMADEISKIETIEVSLG